MLHFVCALVLAAGSVRLSPHEEINIIYALSNFKHYHKHLSSHDRRSAETQIAPDLEPFGEIAEFVF